MFSHLFFREISWKTNSPDMYDYYYMLNAIKGELTSGPRTRSESECERDDLVMTFKTNKTKGAPTQQQETQQFAPVRLWMLHGWFNHVFWFWTRS